MNAEKVWKESFPDEAIIIERLKRKQRSKKERGNELDVSRYSHIVGRGTDGTPKPARQVGWEKGEEEEEDERESLSPESREKILNIIRRRREKSMGENKEYELQGATDDLISLYEQREDAKREINSMYHDHATREMAANWKRLNRTFRAQLEDAMNRKNHSERTVNKVKAQTDYERLVAQMKAEQDQFKEAFKKKHRAHYNDMLKEKYQEIDRRMEKLHAQDLNARRNAQTKNKTFVPETVGPSRFRNKLAEAQRLAAEKEGKIQQEQEEARKVLIMERQKAQEMHKLRQSLPSKPAHNAQQQQQPNHVTGSEPDSAGASDFKMRQSVADKFRSHLNRARPHTAAAGTHSRSMGNRADDDDDDAAKGGHSMIGPGAFLKRRGLVLRDSATKTVGLAMCACLKCGKLMLNRAF